MHTDFDGCCCCGVQAWLVPHAPHEATKVGCGLGSTAAVHSGFSVSWGNALKQAVCTTLQQAVQQSGRDAAQLRVFVTGQDWQSVPWGEVPFDFQVLVIHV